MVNEDRKAELGNLIASLAAEAAQLRETIAHTAPMAAFAFDNDPAVSGRILDLANQLQDAADGLRPIALALGAR